MRPRWTLQFVASGAFGAGEIYFLFAYMSIVKLLKWTAMYVKKWIIHIRISAMWKLRRLHELYRRSDRFIRRSTSAQPSSIQDRISTERNLGRKSCVLIYRPVVVVHRMEVIARLVFARVERTELGRRWKFSWRWSVAGEVRLHFGWSRDLIRSFLRLVLENVVILERLRFAVDDCLLHSRVDALNDAFWVRLSVYWIALKILMSEKAEIFKFIYLTQEF